MKVTSAIVLLAVLSPSHAYLQQMQQAKQSYAPQQGRKHAPVKGNGIGGFTPGTLAPPPPPAAPEVVARAQAPPAFNSMPTASAAAVKKSYAPGQGRKHAPVNGSGMGGFAPGTLAPPPPPAAAEVVSTSTFSPVKKGGYAPGQGKKHAPVAGTGIGGFTPGAQPPVPVPGLTPVTIAAPNSADYLAQMGGGFASVKKSSYGPGSHFRPSGGTVGGKAEAVSRAEYMEKMGGGTAPVKEATYGLGNGKIYSSTGGSGIGFSYLESFGVPTSAYEERSTFVPTAAGEPNSNNAVLEAIASMNNNMITHQQATIEVLKDISAGVKKLVSKAQANRSWQ